MNQGLCAEVFELEALNERLWAEGLNGDFELEALNCRVSTKGSKGFELKILFVWSFGQ